MNLIFHEQSILLYQMNENSYRLPEAHELENISFTDSQIKIQDAARVAYINTAQDIATDSGLKLLNLRMALNILPTESIPTIIYAQQIIYYQVNNRFCSKCGTPTSLNSEEKWLTCIKCKRDIYPKISPAMIVAVIKDDQLLMAQANHYAPEMWSILAGFSEVGENLEETVAREVMEEVGISIKNIRYWGSQYWPFPNSLMIGFVADYASGEIVLDTTEMRVAGFYRKDELPGRPSTNLSIASKMIDAFIDGKLTSC
ncbi:NAD(+) diphosphatase [Aquella oligotrophica]|uniref:NAD(+) diphosphatase n=1 Tax=Aquella oligotrophica TaxID=2067065 RepID=A0A2I7N2T5_9NEIS|nr:NAD(+) diphosphatase [Aquella oligotrophica]AUR50759.1 NAD(+) diphosphatase [Aquella oligotrophica]